MLIIKMNSKVINKYAFCSELHFPQTQCYKWWLGSQANPL